jgi:hypothetical protein
VYGGVCGISLCTYRVWVEIIQVFAKPTHLPTNLTHAFASQALIHKSIDPSKSAPSWTSLLDDPKSNAFTLLERMRTSHHPGTGEYTDAEGLHFVAFAPISVADYVVAIVVPEDDIMKPERDAGDSISTAMGTQIGIFVFVIALIAFVLVSYSMVPGWIL